MQSDRRVSESIKESRRSMTEPVIESASMTAFPPDRSKMTITRVHPSEATRPPAPPRRAGDAGGRSAAETRCYTVWKRSSMGFQGTDGFCVYDGAGRLAFRVDNYARRRKLFAGELLLMDGRGAPLLALRPQILSMHDRWNCYRTSEEAQGKVTRSSQQLFSMRKCSVLQRGHEAEVFMSSSAPDLHAGRRVPSFWVEGCFRRRSCKIRNGAGEELARVTRKKAEAAASSLMLGDDVLSLVVQPGVDCEMVMAFLVVLDRICWRPYTPVMCAS